LPHFDKNDLDALLRLLMMPAQGSTTGPQERDVYKAADGRWFVTYGGGEWPERTVLELMARGESGPSSTTLAWASITPVRTPLPAAS
jgi:hypothetical protein